MRGVGQIDHIFWHNDNTAFIKKNIPVLYCLSHDKDLKFQFKIKILLLPIRRSNRDNTNKAYFTQILLGFPAEVENCKNTAPQNAVLFESCLSLIANSHRFGPHVILSESEVSAYFIYTFKRICVSF